MSDPLWAHRPPPEPGAPSSAVWYGEPTSAAELSAQRVQLRTAVLHRAAPADSALDDVDRLLLVFEELGSNGLRHGHPPVQMTVAATGTGWMLDVTDAAIDCPPTPAVGRDAAEGGLGLYLVARLCAEHGWDVRDGRKHVWGAIDFAPAPMPPHPLDGLSRPQSERIPPSHCR
jgi:hypothetical protein